MSQVMDYISTVTNEIQSKLVDIYKLKILEINMEQDLLCFHTAEYGKIKVDEFHPSFDIHYFHSLEKELLSKYGRYFVYHTLTRGIDDRQYVGFVDNYGFLYGLICSPGTRPEYEILEQLEKSVDRNYIYKMPDILIDLLKSHKINSMCRRDISEEIENLDRILKNIRLVSADYYTKFYKYKSLYSSGKLVAYETLLSEMEETKELFHRENKKVNQLEEQISNAHSALDETVGRLSEVNIQLQNLESEKNQLKIRVYELEKLLDSEKNNKRLLKLAEEFIDNWEKTKITNDQDETENIKVENVIPKEYNDKQIFAEEKIYTSSIIQTAAQDKYNNWNLCAEYLKTFRGLTPHDGGVVLLGDTAEFPKDYKKLPIITISDIKDPSKINELDENINRMTYYTKINRALSELPDTLQTLILCSFECFFQWNRGQKKYFLKHTLPPLPAGLQTLSLGWFNGTLPDPLPANLQTLYLKEFIRTLPPLPAGLQTLKLGLFNGTLPPLPAGLQILELRSFKGTLPPLPAGLQILELRSFNGTLPPLPAGLQDLWLNSFTGTLPNPLPAGLQYLCLNSFTGTLPNPLPADLQTLDLYSFNGILPNPLPSGLQDLWLSTFNGILPNPLPAGLQDLWLSTFNGILPPLPNSLQIINLGSYSGRLPKILPTNLKTLDIYGLEGILPHPLPVGLETLTIQETYSDLKIEFPLPASMKTIFIGSIYDNSEQDSEQDSVQESEQESEQD